MSKGAPPPWTEEQVDSLWAWQRSKWVHPFTCPRRGDIPDPTQIARVDHYGALWPTKDGWECLDCDYRQYWAHDFMLDGSVKEYNQYWEGVFNGNRSEGNR